MNKSREDLPTLSFATEAQWERWLRKKHSTAPGVWMKIAKRGSPTVTVTHAQALEVALCFGWIDGQRAACDEHFFLQRFTPRRPASRWSKINREKASRLIEAGRMQAAGLEHVRRAEADGRWEAAYEGQRLASVPEDLQRKLDENPAALAFFEKLSSQNRYAVLYRIQDAKRPETRTRRIERYVAMLAQGQTVHPQS